jgi:type II secretory pathway pseudopilin PulG
MRGLNSQRGMSMVEVLLAVSVAVLMLASMTRLMGDARQEMRAQAAADNIRSFQTAAQQYYEANSEALLAAMADGSNAGDYCRLNVDEDGDGGTAAYSTSRHTCAFDVSWLKAKLLLGENFRESTAQGEHLVAILRHIHDDDGEPTGNAELLVVAADATTDASESRHAFNLAVAGNLGFSGGLVPDRDRGVCNAYQYEVCGNGWKVDLRDFINASQLGSFSSQLQ